MADPIVRRLRLDLQKAEAEAKKWLETAEAFRKTIAFYESQGGGAESAGGTTERATPGKLLDDKMYEIIKETGHPLHYRDVHAALRRRGIEVPGDDPVKNTGAHLSSDERFANVGRGMWGLREWGKPDGTSDALPVTAATEEPDTNGEDWPRL